ncbi:hypothetical protein OH77DRAFT_1429529 [Trametes cingulata]|nr:hypothetical protein OH77DRAFT_1429529 [Trametes cingulata]
MSEAKLSRRCNECDVKLAGAKAARLHGETTGHQWQPWLGCLACHKGFTRRNLYKGHIPTCAGRATIPVLDGLVELSFRSAESVGPRPLDPGIIRAKRRPAKYACARCKTEFANVVDLVVHTEQPCTRQAGSSADVSHDAMAESSISGLQADAELTLGPSKSIYSRSSHGDIEGGDLGSHCSTVGDDDVPAAEWQLVSGSSEPRRSTDHLACRAGTPQQTNLGPEETSLVDDSDEDANAKPTMQDNLTFTPQAQHDSDGIPQRVSVSPIHFAGVADSSVSKTSAIYDHSQLTANDDAPMSTHWHCRSCLSDPCVKPVATVCGHIFCHRCIVRELESHGSCPVCQETYLLTLDVGVDT